MQQSEATHVPTELIPDVIAMCEEITDEFDLITGDSRFSEKVRGDRGEVVSYVGSGSFWHKLRVGNAVINLELFHWDSNRPPRNLAVLKDQKSVWPCSLGIEHPAVSENGIDVRSEMACSPDAEYYEIRPIRDGQGLRLCLTGGSSEETLFRNTRTNGVNELWDAIEAALQSKELKFEGVSAYYIVQSRMAPYLQHLDAKIKSRADRQLMPDGEWQSNHELELSVAGVLRFIAKWANSYSASFPLQLNYSVAGPMTVDVPEVIIPNLRTDDLRKLAELDPRDSWATKLEKEIARHEVPARKKLRHQAEFTRTDCRLVSVVGHDFLRLYAAQYADALMPG